MQQRVRDKSLDSRKVRGESNPADLFTKHLSSEERIKDLLMLFGCQFAEGRAEGAPQLRSSTGEKQESVLVCDLVQDGGDEATTMVGGYAYPTECIEPEGIIVPNAHWHDLKCLPHCIGGNLDLVFPKAVAAPAMEEAPELADELEQRGGLSQCRC